MPENNPLVSIITPAYRAQPFIDRAVRSVLAQTYNHWEMIIISDDGEDYQSVLAGQGIGDPRLRFTATGGTKTGASHARNAGLDAASGHIIALLDADDAFYPMKLERMVPMALRHGMCACALEVTRCENSGKRHLRTVGANEADGLLSPESYLSMLYSGNSMLVFDRRKMPIRWREDLEVMEDLVFAMCAFEYLPRVYHLREPLYEYIYRKDSLCTAAEAPARFIVAKKRILAMLNDGTLGIERKDTVSSLRAFIIQSLSVEEEYEKAVKSGSPVTFLELLEKRLFASR